MLAMGVEKREFIIEKLLKEDSEFRDLFKEHQNFETRLQELDRQKFLTSEEEIERKKIQKLKLSGKDRMEQILQSSRQRCIFEA